MKLRDRIVELKRVNTAELQDNAGNWREHPQAQRDALRGVLAEIGMADALLAYHSERNDGALTLVDGHLRKEDHPGTWPVLILDIDDSEADLMLATLNPLAGMAEMAGQELKALLDELPGSLDDGLQAMLDELAGEADLLVDIEEMLEGSISDREGVGQRLGDKKRQIKPVLYVEDVTIFEQAIRSTGFTNRGEALIEICSQYLKDYGEEEG